MKRAILLLALLTTAAVVFAAACGSENDSRGRPAEGQDELPSTDIDRSAADDAAATMPGAVEEGPISEEAAGGEEPVAAPQTQGEGETGLGAGSLGRKIIHSATIELEVDDVMRGFTNATRIATEAGGFVAASNVYSEDDQRYATLTIRVPAEEYSGALERLRDLGEVSSEGSNAGDVTEEYTDLQSRLSNLQAVEAQYVLLLGQATNINDILVVQDRLNVTRAEIEQIQGRLAVIDDLAELASIDVFLSPPPVSSVDSGEGWRLLAPAETAIENSYDVLRDLAAGLIAAGIYGLWLLPLAVVGLAVARILSRRRPAQVS
jgi:hypothetical protein